MPYDLLIKNGRIIDGSGRPAFHGDVGVAQGKIVELGRLAGPGPAYARAGRPAAPGRLRRRRHLHPAGAGHAVTRLSRGLLSRRA